jgi:hypothetical protein
LCGSGRRSCPVLHVSYVTDGRAREFRTPVETMRHVYPAWQALKAPADQGSDELTAARRAADPA